MKKIERKTTKSKTKKLSQGSYVYLEIPETILLKFGILLKVEGNFTAKFVSFCKDRMESHMCIFVLPVIIRMSDHLSLLRNFKSKCFDHHQLNSMISIKLIKDLISFIQDLQFLKASVRDLLKEMVKALICVSQTIFVFMFYFWT